MCKFLTAKFIRTISILSLIAALSTWTFAQTNLTQIRDTILNADGTLFNGTVVITWVGFSTPTSGTVSPLSTSARIYNGALSVLLVPSTTAASGSYYAVNYYSSDGTTTWSEQWQVPPSTNPLSVSGVRVSGSQSGGGGSGSGSPGNYATLPIALNQVTGLSDDLNTINSTIGSLTTTVTNLSATVQQLSAQVAALQGGSGSLAAAFSDAETPGGAVNGTNTSFTLANTPLPPASLSLYRNGLVQSSGIDFTLAGSTVTFLPDAIPQTGDTLLAFYRIAGATTPVPNFSDSETPSGTINGTNTSFTLAHTPSPAASLKLYKNGMLLTQNADYTLSGTTITFNSASVPQTGDLIVASYRY